MPWLYQYPQVPIKSVKNKLSKNKKMRFFLMSQGSFYPRIRAERCVLQLVYRHTDRHTDRVTTEGTLSWFHDFFPSIYHQGSAQEMNPDVAVALFICCTWELGQFSFLGEV